MLDLEYIKKAKEVLEANASPHKGRMLSFAGRDDTVYTISEAGASIEAIEELHYLLQGKLV